MNVDENYLQSLQDLHQRQTQANCDELVIFKITTDLSKTLSSDIMSTRSAEALFDSRVIMCLSSLVLIFSLLS